MLCKVGISISRGLRVGAALGLLLVGAADFSGAEAQAPVAQARIDSPGAGAHVEGVVEIRGRAAMSDGGRVAFYRILLGEGRTPVAMRPLGPPYDRPVDNGVLATWDTDRFPSGEYLLTLQVYTQDEAYVSASRMVTIKYKPTPTALAILLPTVGTVPTLVPTPESAVAVGPVDAPPPLNVVIAPFDDSAPSVVAPAAVPTIAPPRAVVPIQPIPLDPNNPGPFPVDTPTTWSSGQLPGDPAPIYLTPIQFNP